MNDQPASRSEVELLCRAGQGDREAFAELYDRYARALFSIAVKILQDQREAEDVLQDVFLQLWDKARAYNPALGRPFSWVLTMTRNKALDRLRALRRRAEFIVEEPPPARDDADAPPPPDAIVWPEDIGSRERAQIIQSAMAALPAEQRRAIELAFFSGLTQEEIAAQLREPLGTVKARIRRGMLKLRDTLEGRL